MSHPGSPILVAAVALAVSVGLGAGIALGAENRSRTDADAEADGGSSSLAPVVGDPAVPLGRPFTLAVGESAVLEDGLGVEFVSVIADSRCPADVQCVWEGDAEITIDVAKTGESPASVRLNTNPSFTTAAAYLSYTVELLNLEPYPTTDAQSDEPYRATLLVDLSGDETTPMTTTSPTPAVLVSG